MIKRFVFKYYPLERLGIKSDCNVAVYDCSPYYGYKLEDARIVSVIPEYWLEWEREGAGKIIEVLIECSECVRSDYLT
jgi:hypothetical protein